MTEPTTPLREQLADTIRALVDPYDHLEPYHLALRSPIPGGPTHIAMTHRTSHASLLEQLANAVERTAGGSGAGKGYESTETARLAAIDRHNAIRQETHQWTRNLGIVDRRKLADNLRALPGAAHIPARLVRDAQRWLTWAQIVTSWETAPRTIRTNCPNCRQRGSIKARVQPDKAWCTECDMTWSTMAEMAELADHVRAENGERIDA